MPSEKHVPAHVEHHCEPCQFHKLIAVSFDDCGYKEWGCTHSDSLFVPLKVGPLVYNLDARIADSRAGHRYIGRQEQCPPWCPLLSENAQKPDDLVFPVNQSHTSPKIAAGSPAKGH